MYLLNTLKMTSDSVILQKLEKCYLPKLSRNLEESESHSEVEKWETNLNENFPAVINLLNDLKLKECSSPQTVISSLFLLYLQLHSVGRWKTRKCEEYAQKLNYHFQLLYDAHLSNVLKTDKVYETQDVFDKCMELLHLKLTPNDFKKFPALIQAYCFIINDLKAYKITLQPTTVMPLSLLLIEDYVNENRLKGLECCSAILKCLTPEHFKEGNYYEVVYRVLKKVVTERDIDITKLVLDCFLDLIIILPQNIKVSTVDEILGIVLEQMYTESNLYRKKSLFNFLNKIIPIHGIHCVKRHLFLPVIWDNLDICSNEAVEEILLGDVVECLELWLQYCWCVWKLSPNQKLMSALIKMLFIVREKMDISTKIQNIFLTLCKLSTKDEQKEISNNIKNSIEELLRVNEKFAKTLQKLESSISKDFHN